MTITRQPQDKTRQDKARQDKQDKTRQDKTRQNKTRPDKTRQDKPHHTRQDHIRPLENSQPVLVLTASSCAVKPCICASFSPEMLLKKPILSRSSCFHRVGVSVRVRVCEGEYL